MSATRGATESLDGLELGGKLQGLTSMFGDAVKKEIDTNYKKGIVWWRGPRVAEWDLELGKMVLKGSAAIYEADFQRLMASA